MINNGTKQKRIAVFDLDGTLVDSDRLMSRELIETFKGLGVSITEEEASIEGKIDKYALASRYGFSRDALDESYRKNFKSKYSLDDALDSGEIALYPETTRVLDALREDGVDLRLLSRATRESDALQKVNYLGLEEYFGDRIKVVSGNQTKYQGALDLLKMGQGQDGKVYCIGDRAEDVLIADDLTRNYQMNAQGIYVHRSDSPDTNLAGYKRVKTLDEIPELVL